MAESTNGPKAAGRNTSASVSKMEAVRQALHQLGRNAKPLKLKAVIMEKFGIDMSPDHISNYKSTILKGKGKSAKKATGLKTAATMPAAKPVATNAHGRPGLSPEDVENVKTLVRRFGPDSLKKLIDVLVK